MQLEEELTLCKSEVEELQTRLHRESPDTSAGEPGSETLVLRERLESARREESAQLRERYESMLNAGRQETERLRSTTERQGTELGKLRQRLQQATLENMEMMDGWKAKLDALVGDHQRALEELRSSLSGSKSPGSEGTNGAGLESLRMEQQLEMENLKAKHEIELAVLAKEREELRARVRELRDRLEESEEGGRGGSLEFSEKPEPEPEKLRERLELAEKKMADYEALQVAEAQSRAEIRDLQEKLRVSENRLHAVDDGRIGQDVKVSHMTLRLSRTNHPKTTNSTKNKYE